MNTSKAAVYALAWDRSCAWAGLRAEKSTDPDRFLDAFIIGVNKFEHPSGGFAHPGSQETVRPRVDHVLMAAHIEALAAARALSAVWHETWCPCNPCLIRRTSNVRRSEGEKRV